MQSLKTKRNINNSNSTLSQVRAKWTTKMVQKDKAECRRTFHKKEEEDDDDEFCKKLIYHEAPFRRGEIIEIDAFKMEIRDELICYENYNGIIKIHHRISET